MFSKRFIAWVLFLLVLAGLLFALHKISEPKPATDEPATTVESKKSPAIPEKQVIPTEVKVERDYSAYSDAMTKGSEEGCGQIQFDENLKQKCLDGVRYSGIIRDRNVSQCDQLFDPKTRAFCVNKIQYLQAIDQLDAVACDAIEDPQLKSDCRDQVSVFSNANRQTVESCQAIRSATLQKTCLDQARYRAGVEGKQADQCDQIQDRTLRDRCKKVVTRAPVAAGAGKPPVAKTTEEKKKDCETLKEVDRSACRDKANYKLALEKKDLVYCAQITDSQKKEQCQKEQGNQINRSYLRAAIADSDPSLCQKILDTEARENCLTFVK